MTEARSSVAIGIDIGGTKILGGCVTEDGHILQTKQVATPATPTAILEAVGELCLDLKASATTVVGIGIGSAGMVNADTGEVIHANENLPGWTGTRFDDLDTLPVIAENDVRAMAYAEAVLGVGKAYETVLCITVGTGIGGGLILGGDIWHGANYSAGEVGYLIVSWDGDKPIIFDQFASGPAIEKTYQSKYPANEKLSLVNIKKRADDGDVIAQQVIHQKAEQFGMILGGYVTSINPQAIVIGGGVTQIGSRWWEPMENAFRQTVPAPVKATPLMLSSLGIEAVMLGAAMLAWKRSKP